MIYTDCLVTLRAMTYPIVNGVQTAALSTSREIWAKHKTATRSEFYAAQQAGHAVTDVFLVFAFEYDGEQELEWNSEIYDVVRVYRDDTDVVELNCERRTGK